MSGRHNFKRAFGRGRRKVTIVNACLVWIL